ncbi:MAG: formylglycine-generating enzyme family protein [Anaerolineae bacterium]|nr:formylglycine-generating enzyme family protein [Anaerolineae bacterium]
MRRIILIPLFLLGLLVAACSSDEASAPEVDLEGTVAAAVMATLELEQAQPAAELPEPTPLPTYTPYPTYTPFPTVEPAPAEVEPETEEAEAAADGAATEETGIAGSGAAAAPEPVVVEPAQPVETGLRSQDEAVLVLVPAGPFLMGASDENLAVTAAGGPPKLAGGDEQPQFEVNLDAYWIDQTEVTNAQYSQFVNLTGYKTVAELETFGFSDGEQIDGATFYHPQGVESGIDDKLNHPVVQVAWEDARAYCDWVGARLPTEAEWEKAAKGAANDRAFPWGNAFQLPEFDVSTAANFCDSSCPYEDSKDNNVNDGFARTAPVGSFPAGASPYGALDMAGNVWEWVDGSYEGYPGNSYELAEEFGDYFRVVRGGSWDNSAQILRSTFRQNNPPRTRSDGTGFRCAISAAAFQPAPIEDVAPETVTDPAAEEAPAEPADETGGEAPAEAPADADAEQPAEGEEAPAEPAAEPTPEG